MQPIQQAAALADREDTPVDARLAALSDRVAELRDSLAALQARLDLTSATLRVAARPGGAGACDAIKVTERRDR